MDQVVTMPLLFTGLLQSMTHIVMKTSVLVPARMALPLIALLEEAGL